MTALMDAPQPREALAPPPPSRASGEPGRPKYAHPNAILAVILGGAVAVVGLWWANTPSVSGLGDWLTNAGRITGLLAGYGVVVLVALMARIPPLERGIGADRLARWHSMGGRYSVSLVVAHALLIVWGYAVTDHKNVATETKTVVFTYPDVLLATIGGLLLVAVGAVSARAARRRMRYETWYFLHLSTYAAIALAFNHQLSTGAEFQTHPVARYLWTGLYVVVGLAIAWYRFVVPIRQAFRHQLRVVGVQPEGPGVVSLLISGRNLAALGAEPGQFFRWRFLERGLWWASNPYSLSAPPGPDLLRITVKAFGDHSAALARIRPGTRVLAEGPYGALTGARRRQRKALLIAGGVGITPLRALFQTLPAAAGDLTLVYRVSSHDDVLFRRELDTIAAARGARLHVVAGRRDELGHDPLSAAALMANIPDLRQHDVYLCGPVGMTESALRSLRAAKVPRTQIHHEAFGF